MISISIVSKSCKSASFFYWTELKHTFSYHNPLSLITDTEYGGTSFGQRGKADTNVSARLFLLGVIQSLSGATGMSSSSASLFFRPKCPRRSSEIRFRINILPGSSMSARGAAGGLCLVPFPMRRFLRAPDQQQLMIWVRASTDVDYCYVFYHFSLLIQLKLSPLLLLSSSFSFSFSYSSFLFSSFSSFYPLLPYFPFPSQTSLPKLLHGPGPTTSKVGHLPA